MCENCWGDAFLKMHLSMSKSQTEHYNEIVKVHTCSPKEQAGQFWDKEKQCDIRIIRKEE